MDPELSLIMANYAKVSAGDLVYDPFVGSGIFFTFSLKIISLFREFLFFFTFLHIIFTAGSLLVAAAYFGGYVFGVDIDYLMIHGKTKPTRKQNRVRVYKNEWYL